MAKVGNGCSRMLLRKSRPACCTYHGQTLFFRHSLFFQKLCHNGKAEEVIKAPTIVKALIELMAGAVDISPAVKVNIHAHIKQLEAKSATDAAAFVGSEK